LLDVYRGMELEDLTGIAHRFGIRLRMAGIRTTLDFLAAPEELLRKHVFESINGLHWHERLRGYEVDDYTTHLGMVGRQWVVRAPTAEDDYIRSCMHYLVETVGVKLRYRSVEARGVCVWMGFTAGGGWREKVMLQAPIYSTQDIWRQVAHLLDRRPRHMVARIIGVYLYKLTPSTRAQTSLFEDAVRADDLTRTLDDINDFYGSFTIHAADTLTGTRNVKQKIPFGGTEYFDLLLKRA
jgi:nucleotidyltransferase/DNA polymerase involved in DNA repair